MYDTINFSLGEHLTPNTDFLAETPLYLDDFTQHTTKNGNLYISGILGNLKVTISRFNIKVKDGSLCKWYLGNNISSLSRQDTQRAIEKLSDTLHLPFDKAEVTRLDIAKNLVVKYPVEVYTYHLGECKGFSRLQEPNSIYYKSKDETLIFYDKIREQKSKGHHIPELYQGKNILRYEQRYIHHLPKQLGIPQLTGAMLYDEAFYIKLVDGWANAYNSISKINDVSLNFQAMKTKQQLYKMGILSLIEQRGGQMAILEELAEAQKKGTLTKKQAYDLRCAILEACKLKEGLTIENDAIKELDAKVSQVIKFYR